MKATNAPLARAPLAPSSGPLAATHGSIAVTNDIRDIKPPVEIPNPWAWIGWTLALLAVAAAAGLAWRRWRVRQSLPAAVPVIPPHVRARQKLTAALALIAEPKLFVTAVSDALRVYLEERFNYRAPERTTEEFLADLATATSLYPDQKQALADFLQRCDLVKFARHEPTEDALRHLHECALRLVDETQFEPLAGKAAAPVTA